MKKFFLITVLSIICFSCFASFSFTPISLDPLHEQYIADSWNFTTRGQVIHLLEGKNLHEVLVCTKYEAGREDHYYNFDKVVQPVQEEFIHEIATFRDEKKGVNNMYRVKTGFGVGALRCTFNGFSIEATVQGAINVVFDAEGRTDCLGFDGVYFLGADAAYKDFVTARLGFHHYSGHYGDEIEEAFLLRTDDMGRKYADRFIYERKPADQINGGYISRLTQYVRQDSLIAGIAVKPFPWLKLYGEIDIPAPIMKNIRPWVLIPNNIKTGLKDSDYSDPDMQTKNGYSEGIYPTADGERKHTYDDSYKAMSFNFGVEFSYAFKNVGILELGYDVKLNQEGQTMYQIGAYSKDNPWDIDHNIILAFSSDKIPTRVELIYHSGRFPLMNFYWYHCSYISAGFSLDF